MKNISAAGALMGSVKSPAKTAAARANGAAGGRPRVVVTASMGSCQCGDCFCKVFSDGTIQYYGEYDWQCSERHEFLGNKEPRRPYGSQLSVKDYEDARSRN